MPAPIAPAKAKPPAKSPPIFAPNNLEVTVADAHAPRAKPPPVGFEDPTVNFRSQRSSDHQAPTAVAPELRLRHPARPDSEAMVIWAAAPLSGLLHPRLSEKHEGCFGYLRRTLSACRQSLQPPRCAAHLPSRGSPRLSIAWTTFNGTAFAWRLPGRPRLRPQRPQVR